MDAPITEIAPITDEVPVKPQRRRHSQAFKQQVIAEVLAGQESVSVIARRHDINANLLFRWKRLYLTGGADTGQQTNMVPIQVTDTPRNQVPDSMSPSRIEIVLGVDRRITVHGIAVTFTSALFGFVDDLEIRIDTRAGAIHLRSASRVGTSDLGTNSGRVDMIKKLYREIQ